MQDKVWSRIPIASTDEESRFGQINSNGYKTKWATPDTKGPELSVVMPCLNEAGTLAVCIQKARQCLERADITNEIIVADNGSTDGSQAIAATLDARVVHAPVKGYGNALIAGITAARGDYIIMGDADDSYDFSNLLPFVEHLRGGYQLVMGNRYRGGIEHHAMPWINRYFGVPALSLLGRLLCGNPPCSDFHCGLRAVRRDAARRMNLQSPGMEFASEMVAKAARLQMRIMEVPTTLSPDGRSGPSHLRRWRDGLRHVRFLVRHRFGRPSATRPAELEPAERFEPTSC